MSYPCALSLQGASQHQTSTLCTSSREASHADGMAWASRAKLVLVGGDPASRRAAATHETWVCDVGTCMDPHELNPLKHKV